jgi:Transposase DDE domain
MVLAYSTALLNKSNSSQKTNNLASFNVIPNSEQTMPYKHNASRRNKIKKPRYKITNWREYNAALRQRGDITIWFTGDATLNWRPAKTGGRGRPQEYSDGAIETVSFIRQGYHLPLRQTEGMLISLARVMKTDIAISAFSTISKRSVDWPRHVLDKEREPGSMVIVDSTGLKVYGKDECEVVHRLD